MKNAENVKKYGSGKQVPVPRNHGDKRIVKSFVRCVSNLLLKGCWMFDKETLEENTDLFISLEQTPR